MGCNVEVFKDYLRLAQTMYDYYISCVRASTPPSSRNVVRDLAGATSVYLAPVFFDMSIVYDVELFVKPCAKRQAAPLYLPHPA